MSNETEQKLADGSPRMTLWSLGSGMIAALVLWPIIAVFWFGLFAPTSAGLGLLGGPLINYLVNTVVLVAAVGITTGAVGVGTAWLVAMFEFPGRRWLSWALLLPLAVPSYVGAIALVDFLEYAGPLQTLLRATFGWESAQDYWFPPVRSFGAAVFTLSAALYPYVYLLSRASFREQSSAGYEVASALGVPARGRFLRIGLPLVRPAMFAGMAVVMMETVSDFGTVEIFSVPTLTTGIFSLWLQAGDFAGAARIACFVLVLITVLVTWEKYSRRRIKVSQSARGQRPVTQTQLTPRKGLIATVLCFLPILFGFVLPVSVLLSHSLSASVWFEPGLLRALYHSVVVGAAAAVLTLMAALFMVYAVRLSGRSLSRHLLPITGIGYAAPGAVLAIGILFPLSAFDNFLADTILATTGRDPGLLLTGGAGVLILAYCVRFFAIAQGTVDAGFGRIAPSLSMAARSLGKGKGGVLKHLYVPLLRGSLASALLLIFVDCLKELPATLLLRPFNYHTLATHTFERASLEQISEASAAALIIVVVSSSAVLMLARAQR